MITLMNVIELYNVVSIIEANLPGGKRLPHGIKATKLMTMTAQQVVDYCDELLCNESDIIPAVCKDRIGQLFTKLEIINRLSLNV